MAKAKSNFFTYKGLPLVRKGNQLYFGNMYDEFIVEITILGTISLCRWRSPAPKKSASLKSLIR